MKEDEAVRESPPGVITQVHRIRAKYVVRRRGMSASTPADQQTGGLARFLFRSTKIQSPGCHLQSDGTPHPPHTAATPAIARISSPCGDMRRLVLATVRDGCARGKGLNREKGALGGEEGLRVVVGVLVESTEDCRGMQEGELRAEKRPRFRQNMQPDGRKSKVQGDPSSGRTSFESRCSRRAGVCCRQPAPPHTSDSPGARPETSAAAHSTVNRPGRCLPRCPSWSQRTLRGLASGRAGQALDTRLKYKSFAGHTRSCSNCCELSGTVGVGRDLAHSRKPLACKGNIVSDFYVKQGNTAAMGWAGFVLVLSTGNSDLRNSVFALRDRERDGWRRELVASRCPTKQKVKGAVRGPKVPLPPQDHDQSE
ncbi:hypothetical protein BDK51DRAFT_52928 [Blyttiomyces helicus]|uniref:Uncharacterized protein n=1 Tax=Blyttiomyces helicus TaxID=388810 RepID=A0A4P9VXX0_9FUNG|nr:hypothetical protein BDK51DRAFT_52928 [Blyttiomyces helicus]|eukprot:RKO84092.1 hypothetical protein BDK51DRAFT_52928 [Blyttiomyces helicus]